jgi:hypothetical protein
MRRMMSSVAATSAASSRADARAVAMSSSNGTRSSGALFVVRHSRRKLGQVRGAGSAMKKDIGLWKGQRAFAPPSPLLEDAELRH